MRQNAAALVCGLARSEMPKCGRVWAFWFFGRGREVPPPYPIFPAFVEQIFFCVLACVGQDAAAFLVLFEQKSVGWGSCGRV